MVQRDDSQQTPPGEAPGEAARTIRLLEEAGHEAAPPPEHLAQIRSAFRAEWRAQTRRPYRQRTLAQALAAAAALGALALAGGWWWWPRTEGGAPTVAEVLVVAGRVERVGPEPGSERRTLAAGDPLTSGTTLVVEAAPTGSAFAALRLSGGASLRIAPESEVRLRSDHDLELRRGALYVDSDGAAPGAAAVEIHGELGSAREVGTRFEVRVLDAALGRALRVRVRAGSVVVAPPVGAAATANEGTELVLAGDGTSASAPIATFGPDWDWVANAAPRLRLEGSTVAAVVLWAARENGWRVRFDDPALEAAAAATTLGANVSLAPGAALRAALRAGGLCHRTETGDLHISRGPCAPG